MSTINLKQRIQEDMKSAMRTKDSMRLGTIRMLLAAIKQQEVDTRVPVDTHQVYSILEKMIKQRNDSIEHFKAAGRQELASQENQEIEILREYLPTQLSDIEIETLIDEAISETHANSMQDMGKVMSILKPQIQGRADMGNVSAKVRSILA